MRIGEKATGHRPRLERTPRFCLLGGSVCGLELGKQHFGIVAEMVVTKGPDEGNGTPDAADLDVLMADADDEGRTILG